MVSIFVTCPRTWRPWARLPAGAACSGVASVRTSYPLASAELAPLIPAFGRLEFGSEPGAVARISEICKDN